MVGSLQSAGGAIGTSPTVVVLIPTYRRPDLLTVLLDGLAPQARAASAMIIVGDNDCSEEIRALVERYADRVTIDYLPVSQRGVSQVRNALIARANLLAPNWLWLLMLDDDGQVSEGWLERLVACGERFGADLIGGPVEGVLPPTASLLARNSALASRRRWPTGPVDMLNTTQNLGISRRLLDRVALPLFDTQLGASGGEDYDLFRRTKQAGGALVWCDEAEVLEPAPPERLTARALLHRYYTSGVYMTRIDARYDGVLSASLQAAKGLAGSIWRVLSGAATGRADRAAGGLLTCAYFLGRIASIVGARSSRYVARDAS